MTLTRVLPRDLKPPEAAHKFLFTRVGGTVMMDVCFMDMTELHRTIEDVKAGTLKEAALKLFVSHQFQLSPEAIKDLVDSIAFLQPSEPEKK